MENPYSKTGAVAIGGDVIAVDMGGTQLRTGLFGSDGRLRDYWSVATPAQDGVDVVIERIVAGVERAAGKASSPIRGVGMSCTGPIDSRTGILRDVPTIAALVDLPLVARLEKELGLSVALLNDANAAALAEQRMGAGRHTDDFCYVTVSTGIGCGLISGGQLVTGASGSAGELGRLRMTPVRGGGERCRLEELASGTAIAATARALMESNQAPGLIHWTKDGAPIKAEDVCRAAAAGETAAVEIFSDAIEALAEGIANLVRLVDPERIAFGGGVTRNGRLFLDPLREFVGGSLALDALDVPELVMAEFPDQAALFGAAMLFLDDDAVIQT